MMFAVNEHGQIDLGDPLQNIFGLQVCMYLSSPNGKHYTESFTGYEVDYQSVLGALNETVISDLDLINLFNGIYNSDEDTITFVNFPGDNRDEKLKKKFLKLLNLHSEAKNVLSPEQLKNAIVARAEDIVTRPQNQLIAQIPINMDEPQAAAKRSKLGRAEKHLTSDNPAAKFEMQVQNMVGKEVIGISAVAMKGYFAMSYVYNVTKLDKVIAAIKSGNGNLIAEQIEKLLIVNPFNDEVTSIANLDVDRLLDLLPTQEDVFITVSSNQVGKWLENVPLLRQLLAGTLKNNGTDIDENVWTHILNSRLVVTPEGERIEYDINLKSLLKELKDRVNRTDAAGVISAIISSATD